MQFEKKDSFHLNNWDESLVLKGLVEKYLSHYKWFILSVAIFFSLAFVKLYYAIPEYNASASILIEEPEQGQSINDLASSNFFCFSLLLPFYRF